MAGIETIGTYAAGRKNLLERISDELSQDERFVAGWLSGSFGRGEQDVLSDLDLTVVVRDAYCPVLCQRPWQVSAQTIPERWALFSQFGTPVILHENNRNAPPDGTFTFVMYAGSMVMVDWTLCPQHNAARPEQSVVLWDKAGIPLVLPAAAGSKEHSLPEAAEMAAFFWMMSAVTLKYIYRSDWNFTAKWMVALDKLIHEVENRLKGISRPYQSDSFQAAQPTRNDQVTALLGLTDRMALLVPQIQAAGGQVLPAPTPTLQILAKLVKENG